MFPVITLLNYCDQGLTRRTSLQRRIQLILDDNWSTFTPHYIRSTLIQAKTSQPANKKKLNVTPSQSVSNALGLSSNEKRIIKLCATGNIAKAFDSLTSLPSAPHNQQTINILEQLHPKRLPDNDLSINDVRENDTTDLSDDFLDVSTANNAHILELQN